MKILVTGGAGFVGSFLIDELVHMGADVVSLDSLEGQVHSGKKPIYLNHKCEYLWGSCQDRGVLRAALVDATAVFHLAASVGVGQSMYEISRYVSNNTLATAILLEEIVSLKNTIKKVIVASSMSIYGEGAYRDTMDRLVFPGVRAEEQLKKGIWEILDPDTAAPLEPVPTTEDSPLRPTSIYAIGKRDQEEMTLAVCRAYDIPAVALRFFNIYGSRQSLSNPYTGVAAIFSSRLLLGKPPVIFEDGNQMRDFVHVTDVVRALRGSLEFQSANGDVFNVGSGRPISIRHVAEILARKITNGQIEPEISGKYRIGDVRHCFGHIEKAKKVFGYDPQYSFEDGVQELVEWVRFQTQVTDSFGAAVRDAKDKGIIR